MDRRMRCVVVLVLIALAVAGAGSPAISVRAQLAPDIRDRVTAAAVLIVFATDDGHVTGSGTVVSATGLILTNHHVVSEANHRDLPVGVFVSDGRSIPTFTYLAEVALADAVLDLAVLQIVADANGNGVAPDQLNLPYLTLGDSDQLELGDDLYIVGYPDIGGGLTYTKGVVSGLRTVPGIDGEAWIVTDGVISGGSSGGTTTNSAGELVGIPTMGPPLDCRPEDTNRDGVIDVNDQCIPTGGSVGFLRPVNLAKSLLLAIDPDFPVSRPRQPGATVTSLPTLTPTPIPVPATSTPFPTEIPTPASAPPPPAGTSTSAPLVLSSLLPDSLMLSSRQAFRLYESGALTLPELAAGFESPAMAQQILASFGWQENTYTIFAADNPPAGAAGWIEISIHRFGTVAGAGEALPFFAWERQRTTGLSPLGLGLFADQSIALSGPAYNGTEATIFARRGNLIVRVTGIAPTGAPTDDVIETLLIPLVPLATDPRVVTPELLQLLPAPVHLPTGLVQTEERARSASNTADTFLDPERTSRLFQEWEWLESASGVYTGLTRNGTTRLEVVVYRWRNDAGAKAALPYFLSTRADSLGLAEVPGLNVGDESRTILGAVRDGTEATVYMRDGSFLFRFTAIGPGDPMADLRYLLGSP